MSTESAAERAFLDHHVDISGKRNSGKCLSCVAAVLSVIAIAVTVALGLAIALVLLPERTRQLKQVFRPEFTPGEERISAFACIPCIKLLRDPTDSISDDPLLKKLDIEVNDGREDCCAYDSEQITALFESVVRLNDLPDQALTSYNASDFKFSSVSAHKMLYPERITYGFGIPKFPERPAICELKEDVPGYGLEHHREVNITKQGLRILHGGLYYIYASVQFRPQSTHPCRDFEFQTFAAYVEKTSYRRSSAQILLKASHTCCDKCINTQETRFTSGVFILDAGDLVRVKVMGYELVYFQPETSFMGLAMLGSRDSSRLKESEKSD